MSHNKTDIWMPVYIGDYLSKTTRLSTEQHGAYFLLLMDYWKNGPPPDDDFVLSQITRMSEDAWSNARRILEAFFQIIDGKWIHSRVEKELQSADKRRETAILRAKAGAKARWVKNDASSNASRNSEAMLVDMLADASSPSPSPSPSSSSLTAQKNMRKATHKSALSCPPGVSDQVWSDYLLVRKAKRAPATETAIKEIEIEATKAGITLQDALIQCVARGWSGFKAEWVREKSLNRQEALEARNRAVGDAWLAKETANETR